MKYIAIVKGQEYTIEIDADRGILIDEQPCEIDFRRLPSGGVTSLLMNNRSIAAVVEERSDHWEVLIEGELYSVRVQDERAYRLDRMRTSGLSVDGEAIVASPMPGIIVACLLYTSMVWPDGASSMSPLPVPWNSQADGGSAPKSPGDRLI